MNEDEQAFAQLMGRWQEPIHRLAIRMLGDVHRSQDIVQEAFTRVFAKRADYVPASKFSTWLWRIAINLCYDELRRRARRPESSLDAATEEGFEGGLEMRETSPGPDENLEAMEQRERVRRAIQRLPETYRSVVILRHYEDLKFSEIGEVLGIPEGTVKSRMAEGLARLARFLQPLRGASENRRSAVRNQRGDVAQARIRWLNPEWI